MRMLRSLDTSETSQSECVRSNHFSTLALDVMQSAIGWAAANVFCDSTPFPVHPNVLDQYLHNSHHLCAFAVGTTGDAGWIWTMCICKLVLFFPVVSSMRSCAQPCSVFIVCPVSLRPCIAKAFICCLFVVPPLCVCSQADGTAVHLHSTLCQQIWIDIIVWDCTTVCHLVPNQPYMPTSWTTWMFDKDIELRWDTEGQAQLAIHKTELHVCGVVILGASPSAHLAGSEVPLCNLIPLDLILLQSWGFHMLAVVSTFDSFGRNHLQQRVASLS